MQECRGRGEGVEGGVGRRGVGLKGDQRWKEVGYYSSLLRSKYLYTLRRKLDLFSIEI